MVMEVKRTTLFLNFMFIVLQLKGKIKGKKAKHKIEGVAKTRPKKISKKKLVKKTRLKKRKIAAKSKRTDEVPNEVKWMQEDPQDQLLSRFVETPKGTRVGESIGIEKSKIILKNKLKFYSIPLNYVKEKDDKLVLRRKVDWTRAAKLGELWRKNALDVIPNKPKRKKGSRKK